MENAPSATRSRKTLSILLAVVMAAAALQIPVFVQPAFSILRLEKNGQNVFATILANQRVYYGLVTVNGSRVTVDALFDNEGVPQIGFCWEMARIASDTPLRISECGGGGGGFLQAYIAYCINNPTAGDCTGQSFFDVAPCMSTPYTNDCTPAYQLHLIPKDAINGAIDIAVVALLVGVVAVWAAGPLAVIAGIMVGILAASYQTIYSVDMNSDKSMDFFIPIDPTNALSATTNNGLFVATPHFWWKLYDTLAQNIGSRP